MKGVMIVKKTGDKPLQPMLTALQSLNADGRQKAAALRLLQLDLAKLRTERDFEEACAGLWAAQTLLAPVSEDYRKTLADLRITLESTVRRHLLPARDYDERLDGLHSAMLEALGMLKPHFPADVWGKVEVLMEGAFNKVRLREGLKA
jgi:hypothetical protein